MLRVSTQFNFSRTPRYKGLLVVAMLASSLLAGCANSQRDHIIVGSTPDDYRTRHPIVVNENEVIEDIPVSANMRELSFRDFNVVNDFASRFLRSGGHTMRVIIPSQSINEVAAKRISKQIIGALEKKGVTRSQIKLDRYYASGHSDSAPIRISYLALTANVDQCGKWEENIIADNENKQYHNFGCATQNNLAKIIANPADLIGPRGESPIDATRRDTVISGWRDNGSDALSKQF